MSLYCKYCDGPLGTMVGDAVGFRVLGLTGLRVGV